MKLDATSKDDIGKLGIMLASTPSSEYWKVLGHVYDLGLMRYRGINGWALWVLQKVHGTAGVLMFFKKLGEQRPDEMKLHIAATIEHVVLGQDTEDPKSFGGWSQREVDLFLSRVKFSNDDHILAGTP